MTESVVIKTILDSIYVIMKYSNDVNICFNILFETCKKNWITVTNIEIQNCLKFENNSNINKLISTKNVLENLSYESFLNYI